MTQTEKNNIKFEKLIRGMREELMTLQNKRKESCSVLDAEVREINQHIEVETTHTTFLLCFIINLLRNRKCILTFFFFNFLHTPIQISNKELALFQQKLEDEVRKDQQEKRDHQEMLKVLKSEIKELVDFQER